MSIKDAFNAILSLQAREAILVRPTLVVDGESGSGNFNIAIAPSNYYRALQGPSDTTYNGYEFVVSKDSCLQSGLPLPIKRTDYINHPDLGRLTIKEVFPMYDRIS